MDARSQHAKAFPRHTRSARGRRRAHLSALALVSLAHGVAGERAASASDDDGSSGSGKTTAVVATEGLKEFVERLGDGDAVLVHRRLAFWGGVRICKNAPFVLSKDGAPNRNCGTPLDQLNVSCTCLQDYDKSSATWAFNVTKKTVFSGTPVDFFGLESPIKITHLSPMFFLEAVTTVTFAANGPGVEKIKFFPNVKTSSATATEATFEADSTSKATITSASFKNIDLSTVMTNVNFFRAPLTQLTLQNCNLLDGSTAFMAKMSTLQTINLAKNKFTQIPSELLQLGGVQSIDLSNNPITSFNVNERQFQTIKALVVFKVTPPVDVQATCDDGIFKTVKNITFCVGATTVPTSSPADLTTASQAPAISPEDSSSHTTLYLIIGAVAGSLVVVVLLFLFFRQRSTRQKEEAFTQLETACSKPELTLSFDNTQESNHSVSSTLLNDPIIITHRLPYNDVKVATCISRGGFGLVYSGTFNRRRVAIKKIRPELSGEIKHIESFLKEICLMASLSHPRIVEFVGVSWDSLRNLSAVTEFMERGDLRDVLHSAKERNVRLSWESHKARIAMHVAEALTYLHSLSPKVIHRDLKSKNVLLDNEMTAKLSDFGVSRERRFEESHMTAGIGTAFWIAPEVLLGMDYDERADIFSFGVVLSELDTDDYPYWNEKNGSEERGKQQENVILRMVATGALRPEFSASCPESVLRLAGACLDVDPEKRPSAAQIVYALQQLIKASPISAGSMISSVSS